MEMYESESKKWFCEYWMPLKDWNDIHDYSPPTLTTQYPETLNYKSNQDQVEK